MVVYIGAGRRSTLYIGAQPPPLPYCGAGSLFPLWTPANLTTPALGIFDPRTWSWSGTTFSAGSNTGSLGGALSIATGTPARVAAALGGYDAVSLPGTAVLKTPSVTIPAGDLWLFCVIKKLGNPAAGLGAVMSQSLGTPGWAWYTQVNTSTTLPSGHSVIPGDMGAIGWPAINNTPDKDVLVRPAADDGGWHFHLAKFGASASWSMDCAALTTTATSVTLPATTGIITIGTSFGGYNANLQLAYAMILQNPTSLEQSYLPAWAMWEWGKQASIPSGHANKNYPPVLSGEPHHKLIVPRRRLIVPDRGWRLAA